MRHINNDYIMKKIKTPTAVTSAVLTLITIFFWAGFEIFRSFTTKPTPTVAQEVIQPLDPTLDTKALDNLSQRLHFQDSDIGDLSISVTSSPLPQPTVPSSVPPAIPSSLPVSSASASATPTEIPVATASATP